MTTLDPQADALLKQMEADGVPGIAEMSVPQARFFIEKAFSEMVPNPDPMAEIQNFTVPGPAGSLPVRLYKPEENGTPPLVVYFHGGGWVIGSIESHDATCRALAKASGCAVASVEYRLAPESAFPAAPEDCFAATKWLAENGSPLGVDSSRLAVAGDSAGGNLAAVVSLMARDRGGPKISHQTLIYPAVDFPGDCPSYGENGEGYFLTTADMKWFGGHYLREESEAKEWMASPLLAGDHTNLPSATVITAGFDPLRDEGEAYAKKLEDAGVEVKRLRYEGMIHGFASMIGAMDDSRKVAQEMGGELRATL
ncbi:MAG: alpha/beta hydrolase [Rubrobacter sp.]|nr:alpha/beta hydrolase [Rubrobacter sp.]